MPQETVRIKYYIADGYVGKDRPHYLKVDKEEWDEMDDEEKDTYVYNEAINSINVDWSIV